MQIPGHPFHEACRQHQAELQKLPRSEMLSQRTNFATTRSYAVRYSLMLRTQSLETSGFSTNRRARISAQGQDRMKRTLHRSQRKSCI